MVVLATCLDFLQVDGVPCQAGSDEGPLGERRLPGLYGQHDGLHFLAWPQVNLRPPNSPTLRPDGLVWLRKGCWCMLEFDGRGHNADNDDYRDSVLRLSPIRFDEDQHIRPLQVARRFIALSYEKLGVTRRRGACAHVGVGHLAARHLEFARAIQQ